MRAPSVSAAVLPWRMYSMYPIWDGRRLADMVDGLRGVVESRETEVLVFAQIDDALSMKGGERKRSERRLVIGLRTTEREPTHHMCPVTRMCACNDRQKLN